MSVKIKGRGESGDYVFDVFLTESIQKTDVVYHRGKGFLDEDIREHTTPTGLNEMHEACEKQIKEYEKRNPK